MAEEARCDVLERLAGASAVSCFRRARGWSRGLARHVEKTRSRSAGGRNPPQSADSAAGALDPPGAQVSSLKRDIGANSPSHGRCWDRGEPPLMDFTESEILG